MTAHTPDTGLIIHVPLTPEYETVLTPDAVAFLTGLHRTFDARRRELLAARTERQARLDAGEALDFLPGTASVRAATGRSRRSRRTCRTAAWKSPDPSTAR